MAKTALLPTVAAVRMAWALTGKFAKEDVSQMMAAYAEDSLKRIEEQSQSMSLEEKSYVTGALATIKASLRSLETAYKGRELNFKENEKLREAYLESVKESLGFGNTAKDFLKSLPVMTIGTAGGLTVAQALGIPNGLRLWILGMLFAALGYLVNFWAVRWARRRTQMLYVTQDYERGLYYNQYINRVYVILLGLFLDLERIHERVFHENYEADTNENTVKKIIDGILNGVRSTFCQHVHKHIRQNKVTPELWAVCESGIDEAVRMCPLWEGQR